MRGCLFCALLLAQVHDGFRADALELSLLAHCIMDEPELMEAAGALAIEKSSVCYCCKHHQSSFLSSSVLSVLQTKAPCICSSRGENSNNLPCVKLPFSFEV